MKKLSLLVLPFLFINTLPVWAATDDGSPFPDVGEMSLSREAIDYLVDKGTVQGFPDGYYWPKNRIDKAAFAKILAEELFSDEEIAAATCDHPFTDVIAGKWYSNHVCILKEKGIITGNPDGSFAPGDPINFVEGARIIAEGYGIVGDEGGHDKWYAKFVDGLEQKHAIPLTISSFDDEITREEMAEITYRISAGREDKNTLTYEQLENPLPYMASCEALEETFAEYQYRNDYYYPSVPVFLEGALMEPMDFAREEEMADSWTQNQASPAPDMPKTGGGLTDTGGYSQTNVQVEGVDEADIIKNDGKYIYVLKDNTVRIVEAYPPEQGMEEVAMIEFNEDEDEAYYGGFYPRDMFVTKDRLVVIGQENHYYYYDKVAPQGDVAILPPTYNSDQSKVFVYDISDPSAPVKLRETAFDGYYQSARRIGDQVYLVMNAQPYYWNWDQVKQGEDLLPMMKDGDQAAKPMVGCSDIRYFPGYETPSFLMVSSIDIQNTAAAVQNNVLLGSSQNLYASATDLFVANTTYGPNFFTDWDWETEQQKTHVFRFAVDDGDIEFKGQGEVPGSILNQFSMDQHDNHFRIATTTGNTWTLNNPAKNNVYVLDDGMQIVGRLEGLAQGEQIKSTRFIGDRLYMVTFVQVDPLFVIDLENPRNPQVLGELKLPGFSEYLHPYDENHLIGFGRETNFDGDVPQDAGLELQGFKMVMFNVSDVRHPKIDFQEVIGDNGTYSELLYDHKALLFDKEKGLIGFPIQIVEKVTPQQLMCGNYTLSTCPSSCIQACVSEDGETCADVPGSCVAPTYEQYETTFSGGIVYDVDLEDGFTERGRISHYTDEDEQDPEFYGFYDYQKAVQRILYIGDYLYTVAQGGVKASDLETTEEVDFVELKGDAQEDPIEVSPVEHLF